MKTNFVSHLSLLLLESANINSTSITACVRNMGSMEVSITNAYGDNKPATFSRNTNKGWIGMSRREGGAIGFGS